MLRTRLLLALPLPLVAASALATGLPVGDFAHDAASPQWTIHADGNGYRATFHQTNDFQPVFELTAAGRKSLWQRLDWPEETADNARCLGNMLDVFCHVSDDVAARIDTLKTSKTSYFHYDRSNGVKAIRPAKR